MSSATAHTAVIDAEQIGTARELNYADQPEMGLSSRRSANEDDKILMGVPRLLALVDSLNDACADAVPKTESAFALVCERSRMLLGAMIVFAPGCPQLWNTALRRKVRDAFRRAVRFSQDGEFGRNVCDRYIDFLVYSRIAVTLNERRTTNAAQVDCRALFRRLRLSIANLWREFIRESPGEADRGRPELLQITEWTLEAVRKVRHRLPDCDQPLTQLAQAERELQSLKSLLDLVARPSDMRSRGIERCARAFEAVDASFPKLLHFSRITSEPRWEGALRDAVQLTPGFSIAPRLNASHEDLLVECARDVSVCLGPVNLVLKRAVSRDIPQPAREKTSRGTGRKPPMSQDESSRPSRTDVFNRERLRADSELSRLYPGEWVAFRDVWQSADERPILCRQVVAHADVPERVEIAVREWREHNPATVDEDAEPIVLRYIEKYTSIPSLGSDTIDIGISSYPAY